jgi:hypothetical protein
MVNVSKRVQRFNKITYKYGVRIPRNVKEAIRLDVKRFVQFKVRLINSFPNCLMLGHLLPGQSNLLKQRNYDSPNNFVLR